jgi:hypothetical protein
LNDEFLNEKFLEDLETYASLMFTKSEIAIILEIPAQTLLEAIADNSPALTAFQRGRLKREAEIRKGIFDLAQNGSSPAQTFAMKLIENAKADDL